MVSSIYAVATTKGLSLNDRLLQYSAGAANKNIMLMIWIFILAGAFAQSAQAMGAIDATVNLTLRLLPGNLLLAGIFLASCFISLSIGTSVGTIVALVPVAAGIAAKTDVSVVFMTAVVVGGAFFGDNLSFISDTTIAATRTQGCVMRDKFRVNSLIALPAALLVFVYYVIYGSHIEVVQDIPHVEWMKVIPYIIVLGTAVAGVNVLLVLLLGLVSTGIVGMAYGTFDVFGWFGALGKGMTGMGELMKHGCTTCFDHHYVFPKDSGDLIGAQFAAADEIGARMYASRGSMDLSKKDGGLPPDSVVQTVDEIMKDSARVIEQYHDKSFGAMHRVALAPCSPFSVSADLLRESAVLARQYGVRLHTHLCETKDEENFMLAREGVRPLEYMEKLGWTGDDVWFAHGIHFNDEELRVLAKTRTGVAHCPISNMKLSSGIARIPEMLKLGVPVGLAVDGSASNDGSSLMEELRVSYLLHRLNSSKASPSGYDLLKLATRGSASLLGRSDDIGSLAVGKCCDLFMIDSRRLELVGSCFDPKSVLGTVGVRGPVDYTVVQGRVTVEQGHLATIDEEALAHDAEAKCRAYLNR